MAEKVISSRGGLSPFRAKEGGIQELRQSLQKISARLAAVEQAVNWNVRLVNPAYGGHAHTLAPGDFLFFGLQPGEARGRHAPSGEPIAVYFPRPLPEYRGMSVGVGWDVNTFGDSGSWDVRLHPQDGKIEFIDVGDFPGYYELHGYWHEPQAKLTFVCIDSNDYGTADRGWYAYQMWYGYPVS